MNYPIFFDPKNTLHLFGHQDKFKFLSNLYETKNLPKVIMFTGNKGFGKSTLVNHLIFSIFDKEKYDKKENTLSVNSNFLKQFKNNIFPNLIYFSGADFQAVKLEDIRNLKSRISQSTFLNKERFIILDDVEIFNHNCLNALLKIIEEPTKNNYFFLINNKSKPLLETIKSRSLELKIYLSETQRISVIENLINLFKLNLILDPKTPFLSPGNFIKFNYICQENKILPTSDYLENLSLLLNLYKKNKDILFINLIFFLTDYYFNNLKEKNILNDGKVYETKNYIFENLNKFMLYNINQNALLNAINTKIKYE
tara:strand:- start:1793 stop:2728 length:936 start_codon:yes stop_codon:yes gene_type:complete